MPIFSKSLIKPEIVESLDLYAMHGIPTGSFLLAVLENDLMEAFGRADEENIRAMFHIVAYVYNEMPRTCWGTPEKVREWLETHRLARAAQEAEADR